MMGQSWQTLERCDVDRVGHYKCDEYKSVHEDHSIIKRVPNIPSLFFFFSSPSLGKHLSDPLSISKASGRPVALLLCSLFFVEHEKNIFNVSP